MTNDKTDPRRQAEGALVARARLMAPLFLLVAFALAQGCSDSSPPPPPPAATAIPCVASQPITVNPGAKPGVPTVAAGTIPGSFSVSSSGEASYVLPLTTVPGRAGVEPHLGVAYSGSGDGVLGSGFSLGGLSAITRCPMNLAQDGEIRAVSYDAQDPVCLDGKRLVVVGQGSGTIELRTFPDTNVKVLAHVPSSSAMPAQATYFEALNPTGLVVEYGHDLSGLPLARNGAAQAWLATKAYDGRGNAMTYAYCLAQGDGYTAEVAISSIQYTSFEGTPQLAPSRAVVFAYDTKDPADVRTLYAGGMALQSSLRLREIDMLGPSGDLVRRYGFVYGLGPTTRRTLLTSMSECGADGVCKPPTTFQYTTGGTGFRTTPTSLPAPLSKLASPMLLDVDGDGLDDFVLGDTVPGSTPGNPITNWSVAHNQGKAAGFFGASTVGLVEDWPMVQNPSGPSDPTLLQPELGTAIDYNDDGLTDLLLHDVANASPNWIVLLAQPDHTFKQHDTGIPRPFPLAGPPTPPSLSTAHASTHFADVDGDGVPDLVTCNDHSETAGGNPSETHWTVQLWKPASGATPAGFEPVGEDIGDQIDGFPCNGELYTVDILGEGKVSLVLGAGNPEMLPLATYSALTRKANGSWVPFDTKLRIVPAGGKVVFLDLNGDGLPDAVVSGQQDLMLHTWINTGTGFTEVGPSLQGLVIAIGTGGNATASIVDQGTYLGLGVPLDFNGDGLQDLLLPVPAGTLPNDNVLPSWAVLQSTGSGTFALIDPQIPFEPSLAGTAVTPADPNAIRAGDLNGDGAQDVVLPINGFFNTLVNAAADLDLLATISDGMNAHDPTDPAFLPNVSISYGHLTDASITKSTPTGDPALENDPYLAHADPNNGCTYPRACAVGSHRVVTGYITNNGADIPRQFAVRYRDGRYHRLGRGFLGFGERVVVDLDTHAGVTTAYDNVTEQDLGAVPTFPYAGQAQHEARWFPGLSTQPDPSQFEVTITDVTPSFVSTNNGASYMTLMSARRVRKAEGTFPNGSAPTAQTYVAQIAAGTGAGATVLLDATTSVSVYDPFGFPKTEDITAAGVDLIVHVERTYTDDTNNWVLGQLTTQKECSIAAGLSKCRTLTRNNTPYGEVHGDTLDSDEGIPDTQLSVTYERDPYGNPQTTTAADAFGHTRVSRVQYDSEGIYPHIVTNAASQTTTTTFDPNLGVLVTIVDPNNLTTTRKYDGLGRLGFESRPDGSATTITLSRTKDGGAQQNAWRVIQETSTTGGADDFVEYDSLGREIRWWWHGPNVTGGLVPRIMQEIAYDALGEHVARRSVPISDGTPEAQLLNDTFRYDALGREVLHTTPWGAALPTSYSGLRVTATDAAGQPTVTELDPLGRAVTVTDPTGAPTVYDYGPFGQLYTVTAPGNALTRTLRDAYGRVTQLDDPNRGTTTSAHDGFGELMSSTDALGRVVSFEYDGLGRTLSRHDQNGAEMLTTSWTWDTAPHGVGRLASLTSPDGTKSYGYTPLSQLQSISLAINGEADALVGSFKYDPVGRVQTITYPTPAGAPVFAVDQDRDAYGHVLTVRDDATGTQYWHLAGVDGAGRPALENFGNGVVTRRSYFPDKQRVQTIATMSGATAVQTLSYDYDARLDLRKRSDALQAQNTTEWFRYDPVERLTCAYFGAAENDGAPCALGYGYDPSGNGNLTSKLDVGALGYGDSAHPHAVTSAGSDTFGYDPVGNQTSRPGATIGYTPFDLPKTITQGSGPTTFAYDGDEQRIRKATPTEETLYFGDLYERDTVTGSPAAHRYYVHSPERVVAVVTVGGTAPGTLYVHVDHLGSVDVLTNENGTPIEKRSYDPFGQRRNPVWGQAPPASFQSLTTVGYTGQEADNELGLVNMKGRVYDPKVGRFLTTDPLVADPLSAQSWNPYSYVLNNPLNFTDPTGFQETDAPPQPDKRVPADPSWIAFVNSADGKRIQAEGCLGAECKRIEGSREATQVGSAKYPVDVSTNGSASGNVPQPAAAVASDWKQNPWVQLFRGFAGGVALGIVPYAGAGEQLLDRAHVIDHGTPEAQRGLAFGMVAGGMIAFAGGATGEVAGFVLSATGVGAAAGVPAIVVSAGIAVGGLANVEAGVRALMTTGSGTPKAGSAGGPGAGKRFPEAVKDRAEAAANGKCVFCGRPTTRQPGPRQRNTDHAFPKARGGNNTDDNAQNTCRDCNLQKSTKTTEEFLDE